MKKQPWRPGKYCFFLFLFLFLLLLHVGKKRTWDMGLTQPTVQHNTTPAKSTKTDVISVFVSLSYDSGAHCVHAFDWLWCSFNVFLKLFFNTRFSGSSSFVCTRWWGPRTPSNWTVAHPVFGNINHPAWIATDSFGLWCLCSFCTFWSLPWHASINFLTACVSHTPETFCCSCSYRQATRGNTM